MLYIFIYSLLELYCQDGCLAAENFSAPRREGRIAGNIGFYMVFLVFMEVALYLSAAVLKTLI